MLELEVSALLSGPVKWLRRTTTVDTLLPSLPAAGALHANIIILLTQRGIGFHLLCISAKMPRESLCFPITHTILCVPASILLIFLRSILSFGLGFCLFSYCLWRPPVFSGLSPFLYFSCHLVTLPPSPPHSSLFQTSIWSHRLPCSLDITSCLLLSFLIGTLCEFKNVLLIPYRKCQWHSKPHNYTTISELGKSTNKMKS